MSESETNNYFRAVVGLVLVGLGVLFFLAQFFDFGSVGFLWPFFVIIPGLLFFVGMVAGGPSAGRLAVPGSILLLPKQCPGDFIGRIINGCMQG